MAMRCPSQDGHLILPLDVKRMKRMPPPTLMLFCLLSMAALHWIFPLRVTSSALLLIVGVGSITLGLVIAFGAEGQFRRNRTTVEHLGTATKLVTDGWFRHSRNPMYLSFALMLIGAWLAFGSVSPVLGILMYVFLTEQWYIVPEEEGLLAAFGTEYDSYRKRTRRWL